MEQSILPIYNLVRILKYAPFLRSSVSTEEDFDLVFLKGSDMVVKCVH